MVGDHGLAFGMDEGSAVVALVRCWVGTAETGPSREIMAANLLTNRCELSDGAGSVRCVLRKPQCRPMAASVRNDRPVNDHRTTPHAAGELTFVRNFHRKLMVPRRGRTDDSDCV